MWGVDMPSIPKDIVAGPFYYAEQNGCLKIFTECIWKMKMIERRAACPQIPFYSYKGR